MYNHNKAKQSKKRVHISWDILYITIFIAYNLYIVTILFINCCKLFYYLRRSVMRWYKWYKDQSGCFLEGCVLCLTLSYGVSFSFVLRKSVSVNNIMGNRMNGFSLNFPDMSDMRQETNWNISVMLRLTPWMQDRSFCFLDPWLLAIFCKNGWTDFRQIFMIYQTRHKKRLARLCRAWRLFRDFSPRRGGAAILIAKLR